MRLRPNPSDKHRLIALLIPMLWVTLSLLWINAIVLYRGLPTQIPVQFDFSGKVIRHGHKISFFLLPVISSFIVFGFGIKHKVEHLRGNCSLENDVQALMSGYLKLAIILLCFIFLYQVKRAAETPEAGWAGWMPIVFILLLIAPIFILLINKRR
jgi:hypothetical protein